MGLKKIFTGKSDNTGIHLSRQIIGSMVSFALDFSVLYILTEKAGLHYAASAVCGFLSGTALLYILSVRWVFSRRRFRDKRLEFAVFLAISAAALAANTGLLLLLTELFGIHYLFSRITAALFVFFMNFILKKTVVFTHSRDYDTV